MFIFKLGDRVKIISSGLRGNVCGRTEYSESSSNYLISLLDSEKSIWVDQSDLIKI